MQSSQMTQDVFEELGASLDGRHSYRDELTPGASGGWRG